MASVEEMLKKKRVLNGEAGKPTGAGPKRTTRPRAKRAPKAKESGGVRIPAPVVESERRQTRPWQNLKRPGGPGQSSGQGASWNLRTLGKIALEVADGLFGVAKRLPCVRRFLQ